VSDATDVLGRRVAAGLIDIALLFVVFLVLGLTIGDSETTDSSFEVQLSGLPFVLWIVLTLAYYFGTEAAGGQTLGKLLVGIEVVRAGGGPAGAGPIAVRTVLRIVDALPLLYLLGFAFVLVTGGRRQRLGDLAARTLVVRSDPARV
jgi:uncharacterized RDD family membrane protein YckC